MTRPAAFAAALLAGLVCSGTQAQTPAPRPRPVTPPAATTPALPPASDEQKEVATRVHTGEIPCEMGQSVRVKGHATAVGYIDVSFARQTYVMRPVQSQTGAIRMEDIRGDTLLLQLGHKSMLMNVKLGQRLADGCVHPVQREAALAAERAAAEAKARGEAPAGLFSNPVAPALAAPAAQQASPATSPPSPSSGSVAAPVAAGSPAVPAPPPPPPSPLTTPNPAPLPPPLPTTPAPPSAPVAPSPSTAPLNLSIPR